MLHSILCVWDTAVKKPLPALKEGSEIQTLIYSTNKIPQKPTNGAQNSEYRIYLFHK